MSIVTKLPDVSAQSRAFISGRSKSTWHGDLYTQTGAGGNGGKKRGREGRWLCLLHNNNNNNNNNNNMNWKGLYVV